MHRAGPAAARNAHGACKVITQCCCATRGERGLGYRRSHIGLRHFLKRAAPQLIERCVAGHHHHRRFTGERGVQRADAVGVTGAAGEQRYARLAGQSAPRIGHMHRRAFVAHVGDA